MSLATASDPALAGEGHGRSRLAGRLLRAAWRALDGALLLALGWLARGWPRGNAGGRRGVVLVTNTMAIGGAQRQILLWLRHRAAAYASVRLVVLTGGGAWEGEAAELGAEVEVVEASLGRTAAGRFLLWAMPRCAYVFGLWCGLRRRRCGAGCFSPMSWRRRRRGWRAWRAW